MMFLLTSAPNNGVDSILCGALYDYGFAGDANYAQEIHHRLFESKKQGQIKRHDIVAINICRAREHGIAGYNVYREFCGLKRARDFQDFADTMTFEAIQKLQRIYKYTS
jgi:peroxidase